jgi:hypothetical protein
VETLNHGVASSVRVVTVEIPFLFNIGRKYDAEETTFFAAAYPVLNVEKRLLADPAALYQQDAASLLRDKEPVAVIVGIGNMGRLSQSAEI